eukprot:31539-Pelagococcus_subviridis.AAC.5
MRRVRGRERDSDAVRDERVRGFDPVERRGHLHDDDVRVVLRQRDAVFPHLIRGLPPGLDLELLDRVVLQRLSREFRERGDVALAAVALEDDRVRRHPREDPGREPLRPLLLGRAV